MRTDTAKALAVGIVAGLVAGLVILALSVTAGETFGQRCAVAYSEPAARELCVKRLAEGGMVYPKPEEQP